MSAPRLASLPFEHLIAEMAAFPLASEAAFRLNVLQLDPTLQGLTGDLWREAEKELRLPAFSIEELVAARDLLWFPTLDSLTLDEYLRRLSRRFLTLSSRGLSPKLEEEGSPEAEIPARARWIWKWLTFSLPPDLLVAGFSAESLSPSVSSVHVLSPILERLLQHHGYAQLHLHLGAAVEFPDLWAGAMWALSPLSGSLSADPSSFQSPGADFREGRDLGSWLVRAAVVRLLLAWFLRVHTPGRDFNTFLQDVHRRFLTFYPLIWAVFREMACPNEFWSPRRRVSDREVQNLYAVVLQCHYGYGDWPQPNHLAGVHEIQRLDPISVLFRGSSGRTPLTPEGLFLQEALRYLHGDGARDQGFACYFWQVVRLRNLFYRHVVQRPLTPGLQWFIRFFSRMRPARVWGYRLLVERAFLQDGHDPQGGQLLGLRSLEVRTSPDRDEQGLRDLIKGLEGGFRNLSRSSLSARQEHSRFEEPRRRELPELGLVLHFAKDRGGGMREGRPQARWQKSAADPRAPSNPHGYRYEGFSLQKAREAQALARFLRKYPFSLLLIRGLDVCTDELGVPTWVFAPLFRSLREVSREVAHYLRTHYGLDVPPLRVTVHAGEDFVHLLGGLRRIDEAVRYLCVEEGDRLGHALVLGIDPKNWARRAGRLPIPKEERLWDLVWEWSLYARGEATVPNPQRLARLEREIACLSKEIGLNQGISDVYRLQTLREDLHSERMLKEVGFPGGFSGRPFPTLSSRLELLWQYLTNDGIFKRGQELIWVDPLEEVEVLDSLQAALRRKVGERGLVIEVNPTSNLLIGDLSDLRKHPLWRLSPPRENDPPPLSIGVGSDNPLTFTTTLPLEYQLLFDALVLSGLSQEEAQRWLRRVLEDGLHARFTLPTGLLDDLERRFAHRVKRGGSALLTGRHLL